jgi:mannosyltransferase OCH1-like enzyme
MIIFVLILSLIFIYSLFNKKQSFTEKIIPDTIHKVYIDPNYANNLKSLIKSNTTIDSWIDLNPGYTLKFWYLNNCLEYLQQNFTQEHVDCFNNFIPYAYKADFFRYCVLYNEGGWYTDWGQKLFVPLNDINNKNYEWVSCYDISWDYCKNNNCMQNAFIGCGKNNIILKKVIEQCLENSKNKYYGSTALDITGPYLLGKVFENNSQYLSNYKVGTFKSTNKYPSGCFEINNKVIISHKDNPQKNNNYNSSPYTTLWKNKSVFKSKFTSVESPNKDMCILLTTCVDIKAGYKDTYDTQQSRIKLYNKVIERWINETSFDIYVVESSGYTFPEFINNPRITIYSFIQTNVYNCKLCSATPYEAESIIKAFDNLNLQRYPKILKVTGKYFLPGIEKLVKDIPDNAQLYFQNKESYSLQNSEFFGCKTIYLKSIMNLILENSYKNMNFESTLYSLKDKFIIYRFPKIKLDNFVRRGDGNILKYL